MVPKASTAAAANVSLSAAELMSACTPMARPPTASTSATVS